MTLKQDSYHIMHSALQMVLPDEAVRSALLGKKFGDGKVYLVAVGKAGWQMAKVAAELLGDRLEKGIVVTKYNHVMGDIPRVTCFEAGHPVPDENSFKGTREVMSMVSNLNASDTVVFLLSGGGSALFEYPLIRADDLQRLTLQLLACGADIVEMNTIRKRMSHVKGGRFAQLCAPAKVFNIVLSDVLGDPMDMIASGPTYPDSSTCEEALEIARKYDLSLTKQMWDLLRRETPKSLNNVETCITGSVRNLCSAAVDACKKLGYTTFFLTDCLSCSAREAGSFLGSIAVSHQNADKSLAYIAGGETVVQLTGTGKGGRNQELALAAAEKIAGCTETAVFSIGSDGTDGPTDAAGGYVDGTTKGKLLKQNIHIHDVLQNNDAYYALQKTDGLVMTGATGTNVNDWSVVLIKR